MIFNGEKLLTQRQPIKFMVKADIEGIRVLSFIFKGSEIVFTKVLKNK